MNEKNEWSYIRCNPEFAHDLSEFKQKLSDKEFKLSWRGAIKKPMIRLGYNSN